MIQMSSNHFVFTPLGWRIIGIYIGEECRVFDNIIIHGQILTNKGWKNPEDLKKGDLVVTNQGNKKIIRMIRRKVA